LFDFQKGIGVNSFTESLNLNWFRDLRKGCLDVHSVIDDSQSA
jgi:hypothetical protein